MFEAVRTWLGWSRTNAACSGPQRLALTDLQDDLLVRVFLMVCQDGLAPVYLPALASVCRRWRALVWSEAVFWQRISLRTSRSLHQYYMLRDKRDNLVNSILPSYNNWRAQRLASFARVARHAREIYLEFDPPIAPIARVPELRLLLPPPGGTAAGLTLLQLNVPEVPASTVSALQQLTQIRSLRILSHDAVLSEHAVRSIASLCQLQRLLLHVRHWQGSLRALTRLSRLRQLFLLPSADGHLGALPWPARFAALDAFDYGPDTATFEVAGLRFEQCSYRTLEADVLDPQREPCGGLEFVALDERVEIAKLVQALCPPGALATPILACAPDPRSSTSGVPPGTPACEGRVAPLRSMRASVAKFWSADSAAWLLLASQLTSLTLTLLGDEPDRGRRLQQLTHLQTLRELEVYWTAEEEDAVLVLPAPALFPSLSKYMYAAQQYGSLHIEGSTFSKCRLEPHTETETELYVRFHHVTDFAPLLGRLLPPAAPALAALVLEGDPTGVSCSPSESLAHLAVLSSCWPIPAPSALLQDIVRQASALQALRADVRSDVALPACVAQLSALTSLTWCGPLEDLPSGPYLAELRKLELRCDMGYVPHALAAATKLEELHYVGAFTAADVDDVVVRLPALQHLELEVDSPGGRAVTQALRRIKRLAPRVEVTCTQIDAL